MSAAWRRIDEHLEDLDCIVQARVSLAAQDRAFTRLEAQLGLSLPSTLKAFLECHDGQGDGPVGLVFGQRLLPIALIASHWKTLRAGEPIVVGDLVAAGASQWPDTLTEVPRRPRWVPLSSDGKGHYYGLDYEAPGDDHAGQVIRFDREMTDKAVVAPSFGVLVDQIVAALGRATWDGQRLIWP